MESVKHHKTDIENVFISIVENGSEWDAKLCLLLVDF
jgi:hypothetical protein